MSSHYTSLADLGDVAVTHRTEVDEVKQQLGIAHGYFDAWIYGFLENKKFNIEETVAKLHRRFAMEVSELATYELTDYMRESLRKGIIQEVGTDKAGRVAFYVCTKRDFPQSKYRDQQRRTFDMFVSYGTRLRKENKRAQMVMLINQEGASMFKNTDMTFQSDVALRIAKFYPGGIDKMYICNMSRTLAAMGKPIFKRLPAIVSDRIQIVDSQDIKNGVLLDLFDKEVLPVALGGENDCDNEEHYNAYAERVETYYAELKQAVNERGLTVKEWELEKIGITPQLANSGVEWFDEKGPRPDAVSLLSQRQLSGNSGNTGRSAHDDGSLAASQYEELKTMVTCLSDRTYEEKSSPSPYAAGRSWADIMTDFSTPMALFFLDELLRWRTDVEEQEVAERYKLMDSAVLQRDQQSTVRRLMLGDSRWYHRIPFPLRALYRLLLSGVTMINLLYFVFALFFLSVLVADLIVTTFFGFYVAPSFFFPLSCVILMLMVQGAALCTRAVDFIQAIQSERVIPLFERLGSYWGTICEVALFFILVVVQLIIFIIYAIRESPLRGLQVSFATGWLSAMLIVALAHTLFFTGLFTSRHARKNEGSRLSALPFFLALNFGGSDSEHPDTQFVIRTSSFVICGIPMTISMLLGIGFLISRIVSLYACTLIAAIVAAFVVNYYSEALSNSLSTSLLRTTLWIMTVTWLYVTFTFGFHNYEKTWAASVIVSSTLAGILVMLALVCIKRQNSSWLLRISFIIVLLYLLSTWIASFPLVDFRIGLFCLALLLHNCLSVVFSPSDFTSIAGVAFASASVALLAMTCVLLGWYGTRMGYESPRSLPSHSPPAALDPLQLYHRYPVCTLQAGSGAETLSIVDIALLTELVLARAPSAMQEDLSNWFSGKDVVYNGIVKSFGGDDSPWNVYQFTAATANTTFYVLNNDYALTSIIGMVAWVDSIAFSPLFIFLPWEWAEPIVYVVSFLTRMIPFKWVGFIAELTDYLREVRQTATTHVILTGSGIAGGFAAVGAARSETQSIVFGSPGLLHGLRKLDVSVDSYHTYVLAVGAHYGILDTIGGQDVTIKQKLRCDGSPLYCSSQQYVSSTLISACSDPQGRRHIDMK